MTHDLEALLAEAQRRSGREDVIEYPVDVAGTSVILCALSPDDWRAAVNGIVRGGGEGKTATNVALSRARLRPEQTELRDLCAAVPGLADKLYQQVERLHGADTTCLTVVDVDDNLDDSAVVALGIDPQRLAVLRREYPHRGQLKIAAYQDDELEVAWACVLKLPRTAALGQVEEGLRERGHETVVTFAANALAEPAGDAGAAWLRDRPERAMCLFPRLWAWAKTAAAARPTILRRSSKGTGPQPASSAPQASSQNASKTSASGVQKPPAPLVS